MNPDLKTHLSNTLNESITSISPVRGGDISKAFRIDTPGNCYFLKTNSSLNAAIMFQTEAHGLQLISNTNTIKTPKTLACDTFQNTSFLLLEFIDSKSPSIEDFKHLGLRLAALHNCSSEHFGLAEDNFIGSLPQCNKPHKTWMDFYVLERLLPQLELVRHKRLLSEKEYPNDIQIIKALDPLFKNIKPSLLHGDLWNGNYIISKEGTPYLIDPAIYYGHCEVDIAMTKLFGGFGDSFYKAYQSIIPEESNAASRMAIYQLYFLLVHLNLFGSSYCNPIRHILNKYF